MSQYDELFSTLLESLPENVDSETYQIFEEYHRHGEPVLAVEILCDRLVESGTRLPADTAREVGELGDLLGIDNISYREVTGRENSD